MFTAKTINWNAITAARPTRHALFLSLTHTQATNQATKRCSRKDARLFLTLPAISGSVWSLRKSLRRRLCDSLFFHAYFWSTGVVLDWNRILCFFFFWAGSWSRQTQSRLTSSPLRFPRQFAVCVNTLFLPSSFSTACPLTVSSRPILCRHTWWCRDSYIS